MKDLVAEVRALKSVVISSHVFPDVDAMGSSAALALGLESLGINSVVLLPDAPWEKLSPFIRDVKLAEKAPKDPFEGFVVLDTSNKERVNSLGSFSHGKKVFNVDHHISNSAWADVNYIDAEAPSSTVIVLELLEELGAEISKDCANLLLAGLVDDTGSFRFSNTTARAFNAALKLVQLGANPSDVAEMLFFTVPAPVLRFRSHVLGNFERLLDGQVAIFQMESSLPEKLGIELSDTEGVVDEVRKVEGTRVAVFAREIEDEVWKVSLRSKDKGLDVNMIASSMGGGGHAAAAGCKLQGDKLGVKEQLVLALRKALDGSGRLSS